MAQTVAQHPVTAFTVPINGSALNATEVLGNDNTMRVGYNTHDADGGIHLQSSALASRPAAGTAGRKWLSADTGSYRLFFDDGANWQELTYLRTDVAQTFAQTLTVSGSLVSTGGIQASGTVAHSIATSNASGITLTASNSSGTITLTPGNGASGKVIASGSGARPFSVSRAAGTFVAMSFETQSGEQVYIGADNASTFYVNDAAASTTPWMTVTAAGAAVGGATISTTTALIVPAGVTGVSSLRIPHGVAPSSPVNGDMWTTTAGLFVRINGVTVGPLS